MLCETLILPGSLNAQFLSKVNELEIDLVDTHVKFSGAPVV